MSKNFCHHVKGDGSLCNAEPLREERFCYFHMATRDRARRQAIAAHRKQPLRIPLLEDRDAIQLAIGDVLNALVTDTIDAAKARVLLTGLRLALQNADRPIFCKSDDHFIGFDPEQLADGSGDAADDIDPTTGSSAVVEESAPKIPPATEQPPAAAPIEASLLSLRGAAVAPWQSRKRLRRHYRPQVLTKHPKNLRALRVLRG